MHVFVNKYVRHVDKNTFIQSISLTKASGVSCCTWSTHNTVFIDFSNYRHPLSQTLKSHPLPRRQEVVKQGNSLGITVRGINSWNKGITRHGGIRVYSLVWLQKRTLHTTGQRITQTKQQLGKHQTQGKINKQRHEQNNQNKITKQKMVTAQTFGS